MQPRRELDQGPYEQAGEQPGGSYDQAENYQPVKPVGYEARLAFQRENQGRQGQPGPAARPGNGVPPYGARAYDPAAHRPGHAPQGGQAPYGSAPVPGAGAYRPAPSQPAQPYPMGRAPQPFEARQVTGPQPMNPQPTGPQQTMPGGEFQDTRAEELLKERSPELMEKRGDFWKPVGEAAQDKPKAKAAPKVKLVPQPRKNHVLRGLLLFLAVAFGVGVLVRSVLFSVRAAQVSGNVNMTEEAVLQVAGISLGQNMFELDETAIARRVNANRYLSFEQLRLDWPDGVTLFVTERVPCAYAKAYGMLYILSEDGMVLEESNDIDILPALPMVQGFQEGDVLVGRKIATEGSKKLQAYRELISELQLQDYLDQISVLNISDMDNIFLVTIDRYTVQLGSRDDARAKVGAMRAVVEKLRELGNEAGTINVADDPLHPTYMP